MTKLKSILDSMPKAITSKEAKECGLCKIPRQTEQEFSLDVDTVTGQKRSWLCDDCYYFVQGLCRGDVALMQRLIDFAQGVPMTPFPEGHPKYEPDDSEVHSSPVN